MTRDFTKKYRPKTLADIQGQKAVRAKLAGWFSSGDIPQAVLLVGPTSAGKTSVARLLAAALLCGEGGKAGGCGKCQDCLDVIGNDHPNYVEHDAGGERGIDAMRDLTASLSMMPMLGGRKVVCLDECQNITPAAWEAFLKPLEEPPDHVTLILATTNPEKIKPTIRSRCAVVNFQGLSKADMTARVMEVAEAEGVKMPASLPSEIAGASLTMRDALRLTQEACSALAAGDDVDIAALVEGEGAASAHELAHTIVAAIAKGQVKPILRAAAAVSPGEEDAVVRVVIRGLREMVALCAGAEGSGEFDDVFSAKHPKKPPVTDASRVASAVAALRVMVQLRVDTAGYQMPMADLLESYALQAAVTMRGA